jgi:energy-coupling factor transport system ATP-binding protein
MPLIAEGVGHTYRRGEPEGARALDGVDITVERGELVLVSGAAGSGKSTLLQCLSGLVRPTEGRVTVDGADVSKARGVLAMSIQFPERALFASTVYDDVAFGPANLGLPAEEVEARVADAMERLGLGAELSGADPRALSHGQRRLAALACVLAAGPEYLLLDEPTAGLDSRGRERVLTALAELSRSGTAVVVASHDLGHFLGACTRLVVLDRGRMAFDGAPEGLLTLEGVESMGLALPPSAAAARWLRGRGIEAQWNLGPEELAGHLRRLCREDARHG